MIFGEPVKQQRRGLGLGISFAFHLTAFVVLLGVPALRLPRPAESEYKLKIEGHETKIVWYKFRKELPEVRPPRDKNDRRPLRAETKAKQSIVSAPKDAPKTTQMVWTPAPVIAPKPLDSPNLIAVKLPPKAFVEPPPPAPRPPAAKPLLAADAPPLPAAALRPSEVPLKQLPPKPFIPPATIVPRAPEKVIAAVDAPEIAANVMPGVPTAGLALPKLPPRPFTAPPPAARSAGKGIDASSPAFDMPANSPDLNVAIVGLNPVDKMAALPAAPSPGAFSAGPVVRPDGASSEGSGKTLSVPGLFVRGPTEKKPDLLAAAIARPTSEENLRAAMRGGEPVMTVAVPSAPENPKGATRVSGAPDPRFNGRDIFMMAIQMPQLTSFSGSWLMWYSDHTLHEAGLAPIAPPEAHRKVDPKYIASAVSERVEGRVTLACVIDKTGRVSSVELLRGIDDRLNQSAKDALSKWEFYPATRNGVPVDVDVVVEIPFKLQPLIERR